MTAVSSVPPVSCGEATIELHLHHIMRTWRILVPSLVLNRSLSSFTKHVPIRKHPPRPVPPFEFILYMSLQSTQRRILAAPAPETAMDQTTKKHPKPTPLTTANSSVRNHHPPPYLHHVPDPTTAPPSAIQNISSRFSKLYTNHKKNGFKPYPHPQPDPQDVRAKAKAPSFSHPLDSSCTTLTKSSSQHGRNGACGLDAAKVVVEDHSFSSKIKVKEKDVAEKTVSSKKGSKRSSFVDRDLKKGSKLMSKTLEIEEVKGLKGGSEVGTRISVSSIPSPLMVNGGRRWSLCSSHVELADFFSSSGVKVVAVDMPPFMQIHAVDCARNAHDSLEKFTSKTLALTLKKEFDGVYGPAWHCIVGTSFGSFVTHSVGGFIYFSMDHKLYILLFKTTVQRAE